MNLPTAALLLALAVSAPLSKAVSNVATSCASGPNKFPPGSTGRGLPSGGLTVWIGNVDLSVGIPDNDDQLFSPVGRCTGENGLCQMCQGDCDGDDGEITKIGVIAWYRQFFWRHLFNREH